MCPVREVWQSLQIQERVSGLAHPPFFTLPSVPCPLGPSRRETDAAARLGRPRGGHNTSPGTPPAEPDQTRRLGGLIRPPPESPGPGSTSSASLSPRTTVRPASPDFMGLPAKRMRTGYDGYAPPPPLPPAGGQRSPLVPTPDSARPGVPMPWQQGPELPRIHEDVLGRAWQTDPYVSDPQSVTSTIASSLAHLDSAGLGFLPGPALAAWLPSSASAHHRKSPEEATLVYSLLALGAAVSGGPRGTAFEYAAVARYAADKSPLSLPLVQARVVLALYYLADSRPDDANDVGTAATLAAMALQLNMEADQAQDAETVALPYGLGRNDHAESRRRTFWACFALERLGGAFPFRPAIIRQEDVFLRLPTDDKSFEEGARTTAPFFEAHSAPRQDHHMNTKAYLVQIVGVWEDVMAGIYRAAHRSAALDPSEAAHLRHGIVRRLEEWKRSLPAAISSEGIGWDGVGPGQGERPTLVVMHLLYRMAFVKLHRHVRRPAPDGPSDAEDLASVAKEHARGLLKTWCASVRNPADAPRDHPFTSTALVEAVDVLGAEGAVAELPALLAEMRAARSGIAALGTVWTEAQVQGMALDRRLEMLGRVAEMGLAAHDPGEGVLVWEAASREKGDANGGANGSTTSPRLPPRLYWRLAVPMERRFPRDMDRVYSDTP